MSADERREQVVKAAIAEFAKRGLDGTSTADIAKRVGVSQPYLFRLFPTKKALFIEACEASANRIRAVFTEAAEGKYGVDAIAAMGEAYQVLLLADSELLGMQLQQFAACADEEVQGAVRQCMQGMWQQVENLTGLPVEVRAEFFARGMLCNTIAAMGGAGGEDPVWQPVIDAMADGGPADSRVADPVLGAKEYGEYVERSLGAPVGRAASS